MTVRDLYDAALIEINKLEAPSMLLEDYNYFINKAIQQYINKVYNRYEINQQATDDLLALKRSVSLFVNKFSEMGFSDDNYYFSVLPKDYLHILNCIVKFNSVKDSDNNCTAKSTNKSVVARKLTSDIYPSIINNAYFKPSYRTPYYTIIKLSENVVLLNKILNPCNNIIISNESVLDSVLFPCEESE